jgi:nitrous oxidase accessory protein NosD
MNTLMWEAARRATLGAMSNLTNNYNYRTPSAGGGRRGAVFALGLAIVILAGIVAAAVAAPASHAKPSCGATIKTSTKLTSDITGCAGVGLKIGADGITLDLNGHTVAAADKRNPEAHGILNKGHDGVTIRGGTVSGFGAYGVRLAKADRNVVEKMTLNGNFTGVGLFQSDRGVVLDTKMSGQRFVGINLTGGSGNRVLRNQIASTNGYGVFVQSSPAENGRGHRIVGNLLDGNGIAVFPGPRRTKLVANAVMKSAGDGITAFEPSTVLAGNSVTDSQARGIYAPNGAVDRGGNAARGSGLE